MNIFTLKNLVFAGLGCFISILSFAQDVEHDVVELVATTNGQAHFEFQSTFVPYITGPSQNIVGGDINIRHLGGIDYVLDFNSSSSILPEGWASHLVFYPFEDASTYSVQRVKLKVQASVIKTQDDFYRVEKNSSGVVLDVVANDYASHEGLKIKTVTIINNASAQVFDNGEFTFVPEQDYEGIARLQYLACDDEGTCELGLANVLVYDPTQTTSTDTVRVTTVNAEEINWPLPHSDFTIVHEPTHGQAAWIDDGVVYYVPQYGFIGNDTLRVSDGADYANTLIIESISIPMGNGFVLQDVLYPIPNYTFEFDVYANDFYDILALESYTTPEIGDLVHNGLGNFEYTPPTDFIGHTSFTYTVCNGSVCETATAYLFVGKQEPRKDINYHFVTPRHVPVVIDFNNDLDNSQYTLNVVSEPVRGTAGIFPFYLDPCEQNILRGYLVYEPSTVAEFGDDFFDVAYCLTEVGSCDTVRITITTIQDLGASCSCTENCVWPGDTNDDGVVDVSDILLVGYHIGNQGVARDLAQDDWKGYRVDDWYQGNQHGVLDAKYADTDGDGIVTQADVEAIADNYQQVRSLVANRDHILEAIPFELYNDAYNEETQLDSGDLVTFNIKLGTEELPAIDLLGVSFTLDIEDYPVDQSTVEVTFNDNSWLIGGTPRLDLDILTDTTSIDAGITRLDRSSASGYGIVARLDFIIVDDLDGVRTNGRSRPLTVKLTNGSAITSAGNKIALPETERTILIRPRSANAPVSNKDLTVYPNPSSNFVQVHLNGVNEMNSYRVLNLSGGLVQTGKLSGKHDHIQVDNLTDGIYILQVITAKGSVASKIQVYK